MGDQGKKGFGKQKGKYGQQWQIEAGKDGKPHKGKGKAMAHQWQQQNADNEWTNDQGTKNVCVCMQLCVVTMCSHFCMYARVNVFVNANGQTTELIELHVFPFYFEI